MKSFFQPTSIRKFLLQDFPTNLDQEALRQGKQIKIFEYLLSDSRRLRFEFIGLARIDCFDRIWRDGRFISKKLPVLDGMDQIDRIKVPEIHKVRVTSDIDGDGWIIDKFLGPKLQGLVTAEVQVPLGEMLRLPNKLAALYIREITDNPMYYHQALATKGLPEPDMF